MKKRETSHFDRYMFDILVAIEVLMSFTFLGYIHLPPISITIAYIPIVVAGCLFGIKEATLMGAVFGLGSMYKASAAYVMTGDAIFSPFSSTNPFGSIMLSVGSRVLFGLMMGILFKLAKKGKNVTLKIGFVAFIASKLHAICVYLAMGCFFPKMGNVTSSLATNINDLILSLFCVLIIEVIYHAYRLEKFQELRTSIDQSSRNPYVEKRINRSVYIFAFFIVCMTISAAVYFSNRAVYMLTAHQVTVSKVIKGDLLHLQLQFLFATLALNFISMIILLCIYKYMSYKEYLGELDGLTGVMGRRIFLYQCNKFQENYKEYDLHNGWFLFMDVDYFKEINDTFGHHIGDKVLKEIAGNIQRTFSKTGVIG